MALKKTTLVWVGSQDLGADADCMTVDALFSSVGTMLEERLHDALKGCGLVGTQYRLLASIPASSSLYGTLKGLLDDGYEALARQAWESPEARWDDTRPFVEYVDDPPWPGNAMLYSQAFPNGIPGTTEPPAGFDPARLVVFTDRSFDVYEGRRAALDEQSAVARLGAVGNPRTVNAALARIADVGEAYVYRSDARRESFALRARVPVEVLTDAREISMPRLLASEVAAVSRDGRTRLPVGYVRRHTAPTGLVSVSKKRATLRDMGIPRARLEKEVVRRLRHDLRKTKSSELHVDISPDSAFDFAEPSYPADFDPDFASFLANDLVPPLNLNPGP